MSYWGFTAKVVQVIKYHNALAVVYVDLEKADGFPGVLTKVHFRGDDEVAMAMEECKINSLCFFGGEICRNRYSYLEHGTRKTIEVGAEHSCNQVHFISNQKNLSWAQRKKLELQLKAVDALEEQEKILNKAYAKETLSEEEDDSKEDF